MVNVCIIGELATGEIKMKMTSKQGVCTSSRETRLWEIFRGNVNTTGLSSHCPKQPEGIILLSQGV